MPIKPKYTSGKKDTIPKASRIFTDREEFIASFLSAVKGNETDKHNILVFYGVGGIGKTSLRKHLSKIIQNEHKDTITASIDFDIPAYRNEETALYYLRKTLYDSYKIQFPSFEIAYTVYWQKTHPQTALNKQTLPLLDESGIVIDLISAIGQIPLIGMIPKLAKTAVKGKKIFKNWWTKRGEKELYNLPELEAKDILERLPMFFASDLKDYLEVNKKGCVLFIDTYEALWENTQAVGGYFMKDEWIRELVAQLPEPLWVICGREKLRWNEIDKDWEQYTEQYLIGGLSESDADHFLASCGIADKNLRDIIIKSSKGVPYYLDIAVDTYIEIKIRHGREPHPQDFASTQREVLERFLRYLDSSEIETLKVLSAARTWNSEIFKLLITAFNTGYPVTALENLSRFSFIQEDKENNSFTIHGLMNEGLYERLNPHTRNHIHKCLFDYYNKKLENIDIKDITDEQSNAFSEAFYHGKHSLIAQDFREWFLEKYDVFNKSGKWKLLLDLCFDMTEFIKNENGENHVSYAQALSNLANVHSKLGYYSEAVSLFEKTLNILENTQSEYNTLYPSSLNDLATVYLDLTEYDKAEILYNKALEIRKKVLGENNIDYANTLSNLASVYYMKEQFDKAKELYKKALVIKKNTVGEMHISYMNTLTNIAGVYYNQKQYNKSIPLLENAIRICENLLGEKHPDYATLLNNLSTMYTDMGKYEEAYKFLNKSLAILKESFGTIHPNVALSYYNLSELEIKLGNYSKAESFCLEALKIAEKVYAENHDEVISILNKLKEIYIKSGSTKKLKETEVKISHLKQQKK